MMRAILIFAAAASAFTSSWAFAPSSLRHPSVSLRKAGGFEWQDPVESFDSEDGMKIDPARLLAPRLNGANLYLVGMMGSGKTAVGDIVARSKLRNVFFKTELLAPHPECDSDYCVSFVAARNGQLQFLRY
jgi:hypothetical protein